MVLPWRMRTRPLTRRIWIGRAKLLVALLLTFLTGQPYLCSSTSAPSANPAAQLVFKYDVDEAVLRAMERGRLHEWTNVEFRAICKKHGLSVSGAKANLMGRVTAHFQQVYQV